MNALKPFDGNVFGRKNLQMSTLPVAGWYPEPSGHPGTRYWDGTRWTDHRSSPPPMPMPMPSIVINNHVVGAPAPIYVHQRPSYNGVNLLLTFLTCGAWLPFWVVIVAVRHNSTQSPVQSQRFIAAHPVITVFAGLYIVGLIGVGIEKVPVALPAIVIGGGATGAALYFRQRSERRYLEASAIAARADAQHRAVLDGNLDLGTFGQFPPPVQTSPLPDWPPREH